jgi:hypothetical protein
MIRVRRSRTWQPRRAGATAARAAAVAIPLGAAILVASIGLFVLRTPTQGWQLAWWTGVILSSCLVALGCEPLSRRLWTLAILLELHAEFPTEAPSRATLALRASGTAALQWRLALTPHDEASANTVTARMATASALGALRVQQLRDTHNARLTATVLVAACTAFVTVLVSPGTLSDATHETAEAPIRAAQVPINSSGPRATSQDTTSAPATPIPREAPLPETGAPTPLDAERAVAAGSDLVAPSQPSRPTLVESSEASTSEAASASTSSSPGAVDPADAPAPGTSLPVSAGQARGSVSITTADGQIGQTISTNVAPTPGASLQVSPAQEPQGQGSASIASVESRVAATSLVPPPAPTPSHDVQAPRDPEDETTRDASAATVPTHSRPEGPPSRPDDAPARETSATAARENPRFTSDAPQAAAGTRLE